MYIELFCTRETFDWFCGGTLIHPQRVLTSTPCLLNSTEITGVLGAHDITNACDQPDPECYSINLEEDLYQVPDYGIWLISHC